MKILYAIQGTGNGHITVAREVIPILKRRAEVDILLSGTQVDVGLPFEIKYRLHGLCLFLERMEALITWRLIKRAGSKSFSGRYSTYPWKIMILLSRILNL
jgi:hypothetical protein